VVTGANRGIGRAITVALAAAGYTVAASARDPASLDATVAAADKAAADRLRVFRVESLDVLNMLGLPRHEYFRRVLCDLLGRDVENGELPNDEKLLGTMVRNICFNNAREYLGLEMPPGGMTAGHK
jgi:NAD(P)-dependent dehydrogenase (short-subunit alcohol dehydrogenase family)